MPALFKLIAVSVFAAGGGSIASRLGIPLAWLIGATIATAFINLMMAQIKVPAFLYRAAQVVIGVAVGLTITSEMTDRIGVHLYVIPVVSLISIAIGRLLVPAYSRLSGLDRTTAYFSLVPAGISEMADLADRYGADIGAVATLHALRVFLIVIILPATIFYFMEANGTRAAAAPGVWNAPLLIALVLGAFAGWAGSRIGLPSAYMLGPMVLMALLSGSGILEAREPGILLATAQILLGLSLGARFKRATVTRLPRALTAAIPVMAAHAGAMLGLAFVLHGIFAFDLATTVLSLATGGSAEMVLTAQSVDADAALVAAYQLMRGVLGNGLAGLIYKKTLKT